MTNFISVQLKKASEVDLAKPLCKFIQQSYPGGDAQAEHCRAAEELSKLRKSALGRPLDKHESALETLLRYYDQLCSIEPKFPFSENQVCVTFTWKDAFDKGSLFGGSAKLALASLGYEKTCVLFNCGALASQIAAEQNLDNDEGLKAAAKHYQFASGAFQHIKDTVLSALNREPTVDISPDTAGTLSLIMLAQAQEVFFLKATRDKMKDGIIAKLANQAADYYGDAYKQCQYKDTLPKYFYFQEVFPVLAAKHCIMQANAEYHQSILAKQQKKFGEEIGRLQHAADLVKTVASRYDEYINVKDLVDKINRALTAAKKDNDFIYHDRVPDLKDLESIGKASLVKSTPVVVPLSQKFTDLFEKMVPLQVQQSVSIYNQRKADLVNRHIAQMREATNLANGVLASLNLPAAIEDVSGDTVPQSILNKSKSVIEQGGIQTVDQLIKDLPELLQRNKEILDESLRLLDEEETTDNDLRTKFKERWQRTPSNELYKPLRAEGTNYHNILNKAVQADGQVKERYQSHRDTIALLCKPESELNAAIPSANPAKTLQGNEVVNVLKTLLANLDEVKKDREQLENDLKSVNFDMTSKFLTALAQDGAINEESISLAELDRIYGSYTQKVQESLKKQEELLKNIQNAHQDFSKMKQSNNESNLREEVLKSLAVANDNFVELVANLKEGTKFYNELTEILLKFQNKCSDIVFARKTERDELLKDLQQSIAREPSAPSIPLPAYQTTSAGGSKPAASSTPTPAPRTMGTKPQPPARPPPPVISAASSSSSASAPSGTAAAPAAAPAPTPTPGASAPAAGAAPTQAQGPPYPTYPGFPGYCPMPMPMGYNSYMYGQYSLPYAPAPMYQNPGQAPYPAPQQPGYPFPQQPYYSQQ
ncbi:programmed cell death 6-interacting protein isoform X2 [Falco biarmicus]|uniref:programmed cell death 6-interacting protein isoform X2 n=1 Tax=Falco rusticolus TaxID=120794 RepID=UPI001886A02E|nr:programmed cell death 6-interacting protein isoform X2 [Falco rusticolus]XP_055563833.1 programmed cell death 6-interacting protein isoform X2 [Falco cherrug]XP_056191381.1 programmed cell death 6-interacting protein isoform X2 [Falco biarmicus]